MSGGAKCGTVEGESQTECSHFPEAKIVIAHSCPRAVAEWMRSCRTGAAERTLATSSASALASVNNVPPEPACDLPLFIRWRNCPSPRENNKLIVRDREQRFWEARGALKIERELFRKIRGAGQTAARRRRCRCRRAARKFCRTMFTISKRTFERRSFR